MRRIWDLFNWARAPIRAMFCSGGLVGTYLLFRRAPGALRLGGLKQRTEGRDFRTTTIRALTIGKAHLVIRVHFRGGIFCIATIGRRVLRRFTWKRVLNGDPTFAGAYGPLTNNHNLGVSRPFSRKPPWLIWDCHKTWLQTPGSGVYGKISFPVPPFG